MNESKIIEIIAVVYLTMFVIMATLPVGNAFFHTAGDYDYGYNTSPWTFRYGYDSTDGYGAYIRNVDWAGPSTQYNYIGMLSVPWIKIIDETYNLPDSDPSISCSDLGGGDVQVSYTDEISGKGNELGKTFDLEIDFYFYDGNPDAQIQIEANLDTEEEGSYQFLIAIRADADIDGSYEDELWIWGNIGGGGQDWVQEYNGQEGYLSLGEPVCEEWHDTKILQDASDDQISGKRCGFTFASEAEDEWYLLKSNDGEYDEYPDEYLNQEVYEEDIVIWDITGDIDEPSASTITFSVWIAES